MPRSTRTEDPSRGPSLPTEDGMLLSLESTLRVVFLIYGVFWVTIVAGLIFGVGALLARHDRLVERRKHEGSAAHH